MEIARRHRSASIRLSVIFTLLCLLFGAMCFLYAKRAQAQTPDRMTPGAAVGIERLHGELAVQASKEDELATEVGRLRSQQVADMAVIIQQGNDIANIKGAIANTAWIGGIVSLILAFLGIVNVLLNVLRTQQQRLLAQQFKHVPPPSGEISKFETGGGSAASGWGGN